MYEKLTSFLPILNDLPSYGSVIGGTVDDSSSEHHIQMPFFDYDDSVVRFERAVYDFHAKNEEMGLNQYDRILEENGLKWDFESMESADVSGMNGRSVMALIMGAIRAERFCGGVLEDFLKKGCIQKWLRRLKAIDLENARRDIIKIVISSRSGYCRAEDVYRDKLTISDQRIQYEYKPMIPSEENLPQKWSYQTISPKFTQLFSELREKVFQIMNSDESAMVIADAGEIVFRVIYTDKTKEERTFYPADDELSGFCSLVRQMIPPCESIPWLIRRS